MEIEVAVQICTTHYTHLHSAHNMDSGILGYS